MKANYSRLRVTAQNIMREEAQANGITFEELYIEVERAIQHGLSCTEPEAIEFWDGVRRTAGKSIPTPEDVVLYSSGWVKFSRQRLRMQYEGRAVH